MTTHNVHKHERIADRLLHEADGEHNHKRHERLVAEAQARATLQLARETRLANLIAVYQSFGSDDYEHPHGKLILRRHIRHLLGILPPKTDDGKRHNGGA